MEYLDQFFVRLCICSPFFYVPSWLKTKTQRAAFFFFFSFSSHAWDAHPNPWLSSFVSQVDLSSFCRFINSLLPTLFLPHKHWTPSHLLHCLIDPQSYSSILVWISNPQSCGSDCWDFLFLSLSLQWVWSWMAVQKFEPTSKNCQVQLTIKASYY